MQINTQKKNNKILLDTSALIALIKKEVGYEKIEEVLPQSAISSVNLCELVSILARNNIADEEIDEIIKDIVPEIIPFCEDVSIKAGKLSQHSAQYGLSLGDKACLATAENYNLNVYTTDKIWARLQKKFSITINVIR